MENFEVSEMISEKGKPMLVIDNHKYNFRKMLNGNIKRWQCKQRGCTAYVKTLNTCNTIVECKNIHSHESLPKTVLNRQKLSNSVKRKAMVDLCGKPLKLIHTEIKSTCSEPLTVADVHLIRKNIYNGRKQVLQKVPKCIQEVHVPLDSIEITTNQKEHFLKYDSDVSDLSAVHQPTLVDESNVKIEVEEEPLKIENDSLTSDIHEGPMSPFIKDEPHQISSENVEQLDETERQSIQMFFDSISRTVMTLSPSFVSRIKLEVLRVVTEMEIESNKEELELSKEPIRNPYNITAANEITEPRIKTEIAVDEEAQALNETDESQSSDPEHDVNCEPLTKKIKKSKAQQPTSSSSPAALTSGRTPSLHEPVETFFQSIAYTVTSFPPPFVCRAKVAVLEVVSKIEAEACSSRQSGCQDGGGGADDSTGRYPSASGSDY